MLATTCPSRETLLRYSVGLVPQEESEELADHLGACPDCQATILTLADADDTLIHRLRTPLGSESYLAEPQLQAAVAEAIAMPDRGAANQEPSSPEAWPAAMPQTLGEYQVLEELGRGGMGRVYKALHTKLDRVVALKILSRGRGADPQAVTRFAREMRAVGRLAHPNIVLAHDAREIDGMNVLIMEFVEGLDLAQIVRRCTHHAPRDGLHCTPHAPREAFHHAERDEYGGLPIADACELVRRTALGLQCAHEHGLVHRDIKPSNIMLTPAGEVKLLDLGLARFYAEGGSGVPPASSAEEMTGTGQAMGTADYMAPEQASDSRTVDIRADIYSLGCTLYKLLSGRAPFSGRRYANTLEKMNAHVHEPVPPIRDVAPDVPEELAAILDRMLAKNPADRFAIPADVAAAMEPFCKGANLADLMVRAMNSPVSEGEGDSDGLVSKRERASNGPLSLRERVRVRAPASPPRRSILRRILIGLAFFGFTAAVFAAGILITITKNGGSYQLEVPKGSRTVVDENGNASVSIPAEGAGKREAANLPRFRMTTVTRGDIAETIEATGTLEPQETIEVGAQVTGEITDIHGDYGTPVEKDAVLARIDPTLYQARYDQQKAACARAEAESTAAGLRQAGRSPGPTVVADLHAANAALAQAKAALEEAEINLGNTTIKSPFKGVIIDRRVNVGQNVGPNPSGPGLFLIAKDLDKLQVWVSVNEADIGRIRKGMETHFTVDAFPDAVFKGTVTQTRLNATMSQQVVTYTVVVEVEKTDHKLLPYMTANVQFQIAKGTNVLRVANAALRWKPSAEMLLPDDRRRLNEKWNPDAGFLWPVAADGIHVRRVDVRIVRTDGTLTEVSGPDVKEGMEVVCGQNVEPEEGDSPFQPKTTKGGKGVVEENATAAPSTAGRASLADQRKALAGPWKVVRIEKGKAADSAWSIPGAQAVNLDAVQGFFFKSETHSGPPPIPDYGCVIYLNGGHGLSIGYSIDNATTPTGIALRKKFPLAPGGEDYFLPGRKVEPDFLALGIYELEGRRLKICLTAQPSGKPESRPKNLVVDPADANSRDVLFLLERPAEFGDAGTAELEAFHLPSPVSDRRPPPSPPPAETGVVPSKLSPEESSKAALALLRSVEVARTKYASLKTTFTTLDFKFVVEMNGPRRRLEILAGKGNSGAVNLFDGDKLYGYCPGDGLRVYYDMNDAAGAPCNWTFDPRVFGLTDSMTTDSMIPSSTSTVKGCLRYDSADKLELVAKEQLNGVEVAHVRAVRHDVESDFWIEERSARVHRMHRKIVQDDDIIKIEIDSEFDAKDATSPFPSLVRWRRDAHARPSMGRVVVSSFEFGKPIPAERLTLKSLNVPKNTEVFVCSDKGKDLLGYWDGQAIAYPEVAVVHPVVGQVTHHVDFTGHLEAAQTAEVRSRLAGQLAKVLFQAGAIVKQGDVLAEIDPVPFQAEVDKREAEVRLAQSLLDLARRAAAQAKDPAPSDRQRMEAEIAKAEPAFAVAQEGLKVARLNLTSTRLAAPIGGRIGRPLIAVGSLVNESMPLAAIDSVDPMCVAFDVSEGTILELRRNPPHLREGPALPVLVGLKDEKGHPRKTKVESAETRVDPATGKARWRALLPNPDGLLMPGMSVRVRLVTSDPYQALLLPFEAFLNEGGLGIRHCVLVVTDQNVVQQREVQQGDSADDGMRIVEKGVTENDWVVERGMHSETGPSRAQLRDGMKVNPKIPPSAPPSTSSDRK